METKSIRTRITGLLTCGAAVAAFVSLRFSSVVVQRMLGDAGAALPRPAVIAMAITRPSILVPILVVCFVAVAASEVTLKTEASRLLVQATILLLLVLLLAVVLSGFFISFHIPEVHIQ